MTARWGPISGGIAGCMTWPTVATKEKSLICHPVTAPACKIPGRLSFDTATQGRCTM